MISVVNLRNSKCDVKVDRTSVLGNPFYMKDESERDSVCDKYEVWLRDKLNNDIQVRNELNKLYLMAKYQDITIGCWCVPKRCHAQYIAKIVNEMIRVF